MGGGWGDRKRVREGQPITEEQQKCKIKKRERMRGRESSEAAWGKKNTHTKEKVGRGDKNNIQVST